MRTFDRPEYVFGFASGAVCAALMAVVIVWPWGMWVGQRDAHVIAQADRHAAVSLCTQGERAVLITGQRPQDDVWLCASGSGRLLGKARGPLGAPVAQGDGR